MRKGSKHSERGVDCESQTGNHYTVGGAQFFVGLERQSRPMRRPGLLLSSAGLQLLSGARSHLL